VSSLSVWWHGARPRTLGLGLVPVLVGVAAAGQVIAWRFVAALIVAAGLQIGVNFANDYFDGVRGVDTHERIGPPRLVASGAASPRSVLTASLVCLGLAAVSGLALALATTPVLILVVGALALLAALLYSGGPRPYAGLGLGELMVFLFFGLMRMIFFRRWMWGYGHMHGRGPWKGYGGPWGPPPWAREEKESEEEAL